MTGPPPGAELSRAERYICNLVHPERSPRSAGPSDVPQPFTDNNKLRAAVAAADPDLVDTEANGESEATYETLDEIVDIFDQSGIEYAVIKSLLPIPKQIGDIDMLVSDLDAASALLESERFRQEGDPDPYKRKYHRSTDRGRVAVHLHEQIAWHGQVYLDRETVLENTIEFRHPEGEAAIPAPSFEAMIIAAHMLFEKGNNRILLLDVLSYWSWCREAQLDVERMVSRAEAHDWSFGLKWYLAATADVYERTYREPICPDGSISNSFDVEIPFDRLFGAYMLSFPQMFQIRKERLASLAREGSLQETVRCLTTYTGDFVVETTNRYGVTYTEKRLKR